MESADHLPLSFTLRIQYAIHPLYMFTSTRIWHAQIKRIDKTRLDPSKKNIRKPVQNSSLRKAVFDLKKLHHHVSSDNLIVVFHGLVSHPSEITNGR